MDAFVAGKRGDLDNNNYYPSPTFQVGDGYHGHITFGLL